MDSFNLPRPANWITGPGNLFPDQQQCTKKNTDYGFVSQLQALRSQVTGTLNLDRYDYWLNALNMMQQEAAFDCEWFNYNTAIAQVRSAPADQQQKIAETVALPARVTLIQVSQAIINYLLLHVSNYGELGTVRNIITHSFPSAITDPTAELEKFLGYPLPANAQPSVTYPSNLQPRVIVPTVRSDITALETSFQLTAIILSSTVVQSVTFYWRPLGTGSFKTVNFQLSGSKPGQVYKMTMTNPGSDFEYYVQANLSGSTISWPPTAPIITQTVVVA